MTSSLVFAAVTALAAAPSFAAEPQIPTDAQIARCSADPVPKTGDRYFANLRVTCDDVRQFLAQAHVVSEWEWQHQYSHVGSGDRTGLLILRDGTTLRWMVRPGGLAYLESSDGHKAYLVRCCLEALERKPQ
jgi:hypothetical protein